MKLENIKIKISKTLILTAVLILFSDSREILLPFMFACMIHEFGHIAAILICKNKIRVLEFGAGGINIGYSGTLSYQKDIICAAAGPFAGIITAFIASYLNFDLFAGINISLSLFNLIPLRLLDGGRALFALLNLIFEIKTAEIIMKVLDLTALTVVFVFGVYVLAATKNNASLLCVALLLGICYCKEV